MLTVSHLHAARAIHTGLASMIPVPSPRTPSLREVSCRDSPGQHQQVGTEVRHRPRRIWATFGSGPADGGPGPLQPRPVLVTVAACVRAPSTKTPNDQIVPVLALAVAMPVETMDGSPDA